jgi:hypothetical protein
MIILYFYILRMSVYPLKTDSPLIVNFEFASAADIAMNAPGVMPGIFCGDDLPPDVESLGSKWLNS